MAILNSNPEILLKKRKNADRIRLEKQEQARDKALKQKNLKKKVAQNKFIRAETLISNNKSNTIEAKRIKNLNKNTQGISQQFDNAKLLFIIRISLHTKGIKLPNKAKKILEVLKLTQVNTGIFLKVNSSTLDILNYIAPYIIIGNPSLISIRKLFQKRATTSVEFEGEKKIVKIDNNQLVEDKFGDIGIICIEDIIHEYVALSDNITKINSWLQPFKLNPPVNGWGPQAKLAKLLHKNENVKKISLARDYKLQEVEDIDAIIDQQN